MTDIKFEDTRTAAERNRDLALTAAAAIEGVQHGLPRVEGESQFWTTVTSEEVVELLIGATHLAMAKGLGGPDAVLGAVRNAVSGDVMAELDYARKHKESGIRCPKCLARPKNQPGEPHPWYMACDGCREDSPQD